MKLPRVRKDKVQVWFAYKKGDDSYDRIRIVYPDGNVKYMYLGCDIHAKDTALDYRDGYNACYLSIGDFLGGEKSYKTSMKLMSAFDKAYGLVKVFLGYL